MLHRIWREAACSAEDLATGETTKPTTLALLCATLLLDRCAKTETLSQYLVTPIEYHVFEHQSVWKVDTPNGICNVLGDRSLSGNTKRLPPQFLRSLLPLHGRATKQLTRLDHLHT